MKKLVAMGLATVMLVAFVTGCGKSSSKYLLDVKYSDYVELCDYKGVEATKVTYDVTKEEILEEIDYNLYDYATYDPVTNRGVETNDYANITYATTVDGVENQDLSAEEEDVLVGEGYIFPDLEEALIGMKAGESKEVEVELTEDYVDEDLVGKTATVAVTLNEITVENLPEYNLDFVKENTEFDTMEAYEESIKESLLSMKEEEYRYMAIEEIFAYLNDNSKFDGYPEELYTRCEELYDQSNAYYAEMYGMELDEFLEMFGIDEATKKEEIQANVNYELVVGAIAQEEGIDCTEKEVNAYIDEIYADYGYESTDAFLEDYTAEEIGYELLYQKVSDFLYENAKFVEISEEDYLAEQEEEMYIDEEMEEEDTLDEVETLEDSVEEQLEENAGGTEEGVDSDEVSSDAETTEEAVTEATTAE